MQHYRNKLSIGSEGQVRTFRNRRFCKISLAFQLLHDLRE
jgi:hypothetical protein